MDTRTEIRELENLRLQFLKFRNFTININLNDFCIAGYVHKHDEAHFIRYVINTPVLTMLSVSLASANMTTIAFPTDTVISQPAITHDFMLTGA